MTGFARLDVVSAISGVNVVGHDAAAAMSWVAKH